jgi:hypothetical protein
MKALEEVFASTMPAGMGYDYLGMSYQEKVAQQGVPPALIFGLSFLLVFLILAAQYESWALPISVLLGTPIAVFGAFLALFGRGLENNVYAQIGLVMLIGLSAKNAILIVEFARAERGRCAIASPSDSYDLVCFHFGLRPSLGRSGRGGCLPADYRYSGYRGHAGGVVHRDLYGSGLVLPG